MSPIKKNLFIYALVFFSIIISIFIWKKLHIPYNSDIIGEYSIKNYHPLNDVIKYLSFILLPVLAFISAKTFFDKIELFEKLEKIKIKNEYVNTNKIMRYVLFILSSFLVLEFTSVNFPTDKLDIFHSGQKLYPAFKYDLDQSLWSEIYLISGVFIEVFSTKIAWDIFNVKSIGASRFSDLFLVFVTKISLIFLMYEVSKSNNFNSNVKIIFFLILSYFSLYLIDYNLNSADLISSRDIPILLTLYLFFSLINNSFNRLVLSFLIGLIFLFVFFWGIDRAIVNSALVIFIILNLLLNKYFKELGIILLTAFVSLIFSFFILGVEFKYFMENSFLILNEMTNIHGLIHPTPFSDEPNATRATKTLLATLLTILISLNIILSKKSNINNNFSIILISFSILSFLTYIYAIGRSDGGHIKQAFGFPITFIFTYLTINLFLFIDKNIKINKFLNFRAKIPIMFIIVIFVFSLNLNLKNITSYKFRLNNFIEKEDTFFLTKKDVTFVFEAKKIIHNSNCIQLYTNDSALLYLLKKRSCSKYYWPWSYGTEKTQKEIIQKLKNTQFIISNGNTDSWGIPFKSKFRILDPYIKNNFSNKIINIEEREIRFKN